ncbi:MAG: lipoprotein-releasing ABC transporter ATP-binding protein LolD [Methylococcales bacterium]|jgi:lipoprotein-releasing system ATP-binding protein|nr:lipoprotein-releasing ABC transporter ATP-binding protein LolD [Methylococcales bacterium]MBT7410109.1 lipoprotein-releasing ABC transporter ATP-binding protein LolD [Methylococcales bacterium]
MNNNIALECVDLSKTFKQGEDVISVLDHVGFAIKKGERCAIMGASGSGKTTLLQILGGLDVPSSGEVRVDGQLISSLNEKDRGMMRNRTLGFIFQFHHLLPEFTALENVAMPLLIRGMGFDEAMQKAKDILEEVELQHRLTHRPAELSGGERQRAAIARAIITEPSCILADEPTGNLDNKTAEQVYQVILKLNQTKATSFILVTHDEVLANRMNQVYHLENGCLVG